MKPFDDGDEADALAHAAELALAGEPREEIERELPPPGPRAPVIDQQALARSIAGGIAKAFAGERERDLERIGDLERKLQDALERLLVIERGLIAKALQTAEPVIDLPPLPRSSAAARGH